MNNRNEQNKFISVDLSRYTIKGVKDSKRFQGVIANGFDNQFSDYLNGLYNKSVTHQNIVNDLVRYIIGKGLKSQDPAEQVKLDKFFSKRKIRNIVKFKKLQATMTLEVIRGKFVEDIIDIVCHNPAQFRVSSLEGGYPDEFKFRKSWDKGDTTNYRITEDFRRIDIKDKQDKFGLFYWYDSGTFPVFYGRPDYMSGLDAIELEISSYMGVNHGAQSGFEPSKIIEFESTGSVEQDTKDIEAITHDLSGVANRGKLAVRVRAQNTAPMIINEPSNDSLTDNYDSVFALAEAGILKCHAIPSPSLISGLNKKSAGLAGSIEEEMQWAKDELFNKIIETERTEIIEILNPLFKGIGVNSTVEFSDLEETEEVADAEVASRFGEFGVGGVQGILSIQTAVAEGTASVEAAVETLKVIYGFDDASARKMVGGEGILGGAPTAIDGLADETLEREAVNDNLKNLTGRQLQNIERTVRKFKKGQLTYDQAELMLMQGYGFKKDEAGIWLNNESTLSKITLAIDNKTELDKLIELGDDLESLGLDGWDILSVEPVDYDKEDELDNQISELNKQSVKLVSTGTARPMQKSSQDGELGNIQYKVRYRYAGNKVGQRDFCNRMLAADKLYRKEDIGQMSFNSVNAGFGVNGANNYSIFKYKGGPNCKHIFERITFVKQGLEGGIDVDSPKAKTLTESQADERGIDVNNPKEVGQKPYNMPNHGYKNPR